jgi:hypothetical protein
MRGAWSAVAEAYVFAFIRFATPTRHGKTTDPQGNRRVQGADKETVSPGGIVKVAGLGDGLTPARAVIAKLPMPPVPRTTLRLPCADPACLLNIAGTSIKLRQFAVGDWPERLLWSTANR